LLLLFAFSLHKKEGGFKGLKRREYADEDKPSQSCFGYET